MAPALSIQKQVKVALYTTPVIAALTMTPIAIMGRYSFSRYFIAMLFTMALGAFLWAINILLWYAGVRSTTYRTLVSVLVSFGLAMFVATTLFPYHSSKGGAFHINFHFHLILFFAVNIVIIILQNLTVTRERNAVIELENQELKLKNAEATNQQLKQQIQPHFLFNSLSTLKSLMTTDPADAEDYLVRLSEFLRSSLSSHTLNTTSLADELHLVVNYLEMQKIRFGEALRFIIDVPEGVRETWNLPAFSLQMLAENAIKHNILTVDRPLTIIISWQGRWEGAMGGHEGMIAVSNNLQKKATEAQGPGMGLANLRERHRLLSGVDIIIEETAHTFTVRLKALEHENSDH